LPYTTTGAGMPEGGAFVSVGDAVLRQDLAGNPADGLGAALVNGAVIRVTSVVESFAGLAIDNGIIYFASGFSAGAISSGGNYKADSGLAKALHDGVRFVSPTVPAASEQSGATIALKEAAFKAGTGEADAGGNGVFVRLLETSEADAGVQKTTAAVTKKRIQNKAIISFSFDDNYPSATGSVRTLFDSKGLKCGLAIPALSVNRASAGSIKNLLDMQRNGYEILSHGLGSITMNSQSQNPLLVESEINGGLFEMHKRGFDIQGFVAPQSNLSSAFTPILAENHVFGFTNGAINVDTSAAFQAQDLDPYRMHRTSLYGLGVAGAKTLIDLAIAQNGYVQFYDHDPDRVYFPSSLSLAQLTEVLEYAIARGALIVTPREAFDLVHGSSTNARSIQKSSINGLRRNSTNYLQDTSFRSIKSGGADGVSSWLIDEQGSALNGTFSFENDSDDAFYPLSVTLSSGQSAGVGQVLIQNKTAKMGGDFKPTHTTFQILIRGENSASGDDLDVTLGINARKQSDSVAIGGASETAIVHLDGMQRLYTVSMDVANLSVPFFFTCFVRIKPKSTAGGIVQLAEPMLHTADKYAIHQQNKSFSRQGIASNFSSTLLPNASFAIMNLVERDAVTHSYSGTRLTFKTSGIFSIDAALKLSDAGITAGTRGILAFRLNGGTGDRQRRDTVAAAGFINLLFSLTEYFEKGDYIEFSVFQDAAALTPSVPTGSFINVCLVS